MAVTGRKYRKYIADYNNQLDIFLFKSKNNVSVSIQKSMKSRKTFDDRNSDKDRKQSNFKLINALHSYFSKMLLFQNNCVIGYYNTIGTKL